ncbi:MAG: 2OG-Fe(II) oxygenase [Aestuariibacter sp.]
MLINNLPIEKLKNDYQNNHITRVENLLTEASAAEITRHIATKVPFKSAFMRNGEVKTLSAEEFQRLPQAEQQSIQTEVNNGAAKGFGFLYGTYRIDEQTDSKEHPLLATLYQELNSETVLQQIREITGISTIRAANAQVTRYTPGHFLTRHNDLNSHEERRIAYVISFCPTWHPDWGGLLQFFEQNGTPMQSYTPQFNTMMLFDVVHPHSVTYITPFCQQARLSITGWFKEK